MFGRSRPRTHSQLVADELAESYGHLKMAAAHAAGSAAERITPGYDKARGAAGRGWNTTKGAFTPLYEQVREGAANARREQQVKRNKWPLVAGLIAAGAAAGAAGAMIARRRRAAAQWDEYEPMPGLETSPYADTGKSKSHKVTAGAASVADTVSTQAGKLADSLHEKSRPTGDKRSQSGESGDMFDAFSDETTTPPSPSPSSMPPHATPSTKDNKKP